VSEEAESPADEHKRTLSGKHACSFCILSEYAFDVTVGSYRMY